jgi:CheY-like chemotaxis protein
VFWNLLKNAIKFSPAGAQIGLRGFAEEGSLKVEVRDQGIGVEAEDVDRIFLPFEQRLGGPRRASESGLGLGLAIAKAIVEMHGGKIALTSDGAGKGATFTVTLPVAQEGETGADPANAAPSVTPTRGNRPPRLLLVEDHGDTGKTLARLLSRAGYEVEHAETAAKGLEVFRASKFDLIVSDLGLPDESGLSMLQKIRAEFPQARAICMSGFGMEDDIAASRAVGFAEHLTKPVDLPRLKAVIAKVLTRTPEDSVPG